MRRATSLKEGGFAFFAVTAYAEIHHPKKQTNQSPEKARKNRHANMK